jgi:hypothetical protein
MPPILIPLPCPIGEFIARLGLPVEGFTAPPHTSTCALAHALNHSGYEIYLVSRTMTATVADPFSAVFMCYFLTDGIVEVNSRGESPADMLDGRYHCFEGYSYPADSFQRVDMANSGAAGMFGVPHPTDTTAMLARVNCLLMDMTTQSSPSSLHLDRL